MYSTQSCMQRILAHQSHLLAYIKQCKRARHCQYWLDSLVSASLLILPGFATTTLAFVDEIRECKMSVSWVSTDHYCTEACASRCYRAHTEVWQMLDCAGDSFDASVRRLPLKRMSEIVRNQRERRGTLCAALLAAWWLLDLFVMAIGSIHMLASCEQESCKFVGCCKNWRTLPTLRRKAHHYVTVLLHNSSAAEWRSRFIKNIESGHTFKEIADSMMLWVRRNHVIFVR